MNDRKATGDNRWGYSSDCLMKTMGMACIKTLHFSMYTPAKMSLYVEVSDWKASPNWDLASSR